MVAYSCNLACRGCISLSDRARDGVASLSDIRAWVHQWRDFVEPEVVVIFGGEPCLHPELPAVAETLRQAWPRSRLRLITNGYLLGRFDPGTWLDLGNFELQISVHRPDHETVINDEMAKILALRSDWHTQTLGGQGQHKQIQWRSGQFVMYKSRFQHFVMPYREVNGGIGSYASDPARAHAVCGSPDTPILYRGALWKCPPVANISDLAPGLIQYQPCTTPQQLPEFVAGIGRPESVCAHCPQQNTATVINHFDTKNVPTRQKIPD